MNRTVMNQLACALAAFLLSACTDAKQTAPTATAAPKPATTPAVTPPVPPPVPPAGTGSATGSTALPVDCDPKKDFAALDFPADIKACLTRDKVYNFDANACTTMGKALWTCDFATLAQNLTDLELSPGPLEKEKAGGGKLIGCGASNDGLRIVAQFFYRNANAPAGDCKFSVQGKVVSVCFQKFVDTVPAVPTTDSAKKAYVAGCMTE